MNCRIVKIIRYKKNTFMYYNQWDATTSEPTQLMKVTNKYWDDSLFKELQVGDMIVVS